MQFEPIAPRESAVDACARALRDKIMSGEIEPGMRLPPERRLALSFGVNRVTVRGALAKLASANLVTVRQGSGYVVQDYRRSGGTDLLPGLATLALERGELGPVVRDLLLMRRAMARAVLERLAEVSPTARRAVEDAVVRFSEVVASGADTEAIYRGDMDVLAAILDATGSGVLRLCMNPVLEVLGSIEGLRHAIYLKPETNVLGYQLLVAWLHAPQLDRIDDVIAELERRDAATLLQLEQTV